MAQEKELRMPDTVLLYTVEENKVTVTGSRGKTARLKIPAYIEDKAVTALGKKAFLGDKNLLEITLPDTILEIGDWAFAHCSSLKRIFLPKKALQVGKGVFKDCRALTEAVAGNALGEDVDCLLAATPVLLDAEYLFMPKEAGSEEWLEKWDSRMLVLLRKRDESGFTKVVLCGEEDLLANLPEYVAEKQRSKARLCCLRLLHPVGISEAVKEELQAYLRTHAKGCESEAAWEIVLNEHGDDKAYYELLIETGCVTQENIAGMLSDMKERHAEMKAFLMRYKEEVLGGSDFFASLSLD